MIDPHLNLFYSYNRDNELIENNLTRAFIATLRLLSPSGRDALLQTLLSGPLQRLNAAVPSYESCQLALQAHVDRELSRRIPLRILITLASDRIVMAEEENNKDQQLDTYLSIPDGWIYDQKAGYCFLIEAKVGSNPLNQHQVLSHADKWLMINAEQLPDHLISLTWIDVIRAIEHLKGNTEEYHLNIQESLVLDELVAFLSLYGYRIFRGVTWGDLQPSPDFMFSNKLLAKADWHQFLDLNHPPNFRIIHNARHKR